jgi:hypothetical protein
MCLSIIYACMYVSISTIYLCLPSLSIWLNLWVHTSALSPLSFCLFGSPPHLHQWHHPLGCSNQKPSSCPWCFLFLIPTSSLKQRTTVLQLKDIWICPLLAVSLHHPRSGRLVSCWTFAIVSYYLPVSSTVTSLWPIVHTAASDHSCHLLV